MNTVAKMMPEAAKMIFTSCAISQSPNQPSAPNNSTKINPEITGDTENGRSIKVVNRLLPLNSKRVIAQAAATPNTVFNGTVTAAVNKVNLIAASVSGSDNAAQ